MTLAILPCVANVVPASIQHARKRGSRDVLLVDNVRAERQRG